DPLVTGVQTCALPISRAGGPRRISEPAPGSARARTTRRSRPATPSVAWKHSSRNGADASRQGSGLSRPLLQESLVDLHAEPRTVESQDLAVRVLHGPAC